MSVYCSHTESTMDPQHLKNPPARRRLLTNRKSRSSPGWTGDKMSGDLDLARAMLTERQKELRIARWLAGGVQVHLLADIDHRKRIAIAEARVLDAMDRVWIEQGWMNP